MAFTRTMGILNPKDEDPNKVNVFRETPAGDPQGQQPGSSSDMVKTTTEGSIAGSSGGSGAQTGQSMVGLGAAAPNSAAILRNIGKQQAPKATGNIEADITTAGSKLQQEADSYLTGQQKDYTVGNADIDKALSGDFGAEGKVTGLLGRGAADQAEAFNPTANIRYGSDRLKQPTFYEELLQREQGPKYNKGEAAFDMMLLGKDPGFARTMETLQKGAGDFEASKAKLQTDKVKEAQAARDANLETAKASAKGYLGDTATGITSAAEKEAADENLIRSYLRGETATIPKELKFKADKMKEDTRKQAVATFNQQMLAKYGPEFKDLMGTEFGNYIDQQMKAGSNIDSSAFIDTSEANKFNKIMALLGRGDNLQAGTLDPALSYDAATAEQKLVANYEKRKELRAQKKAEEEAKLAAAAAAEQAAIAKAALDAKYNELPPEAFQIDTESGGPSGPVTDVGTKGTAEDLQDLDGLGIDWLNSKNVSKPKPKK